MIYLDNNATTAIGPEVIDAMQPYFTQHFANPSSLHGFGCQVKEKVQEARNKIANKLGCSSEEIIFTSSGTESNNFCLKGMAFSNKHKGNQIITTPIEHASILATCNFLEKQGFEIVYLEVDSEGFVDPLTLKNAITDRTILISIAHANNEIGTIQDLASLLEVSNGIPFHTDAVQSFLKTDFDLRKLPVSLASFSGHKFHAPKGIGFVYKRADLLTDPLIHGGHQEMSLRSGTENVPYIIGLGKALTSIGSSEITHMQNLQSYLINELASIPGIQINGPTDPNKRLCNNLNISCDCLEGEYILHELSAHGLYISTGSACQSSHARISHVLQAIKCPFRYIHGNIRIGLSKYTTHADVQNFIGKFKQIISKPSHFKLYPCPQNIRLKPKLRPKSRLNIAELDK